MGTERDNKGENLMGHKAVLVPMHQQLSTILY